MHQTFRFEQFFNGKLCFKIHDLLSVPIIFFWIGLLGVISRVWGSADNAEPLALLDSLVCNDIGIFGFVVLAVF